MSVESIIAAHLEVFNAPAGPERERAIAQVYTDDVVLAKPDATLTGHAGVEQAVAALHARLQSRDGLSIIRTGPIEQVQDLVIFPWATGKDDGPTILSGRDVLLIRDGKVSNIYVLFDT